MRAWWRGGQRKWHAITFTNLDHELVTKVPIYLPYPILYLPRGKRRKLSNSNTYRLAAYKYEYLGTRLSKHICRNRFNVVSDGYDMVV